MGLWKLDVWSQEHVRQWKMVQYIGAINVYTREK